jgi:hypothetical protein
MAYMTIALAALAAAQAAAPDVAAQPTPTATGAPSAQVAPAVQTRAARVLPAGTIVTLTPLEELSSKHMKEGQRFQFLVVSDVAENGVVVIPRGSPAVAIVTMQTGRAVGGKSGKFDVTFESVTANGVTFPLSGIHRQEGKGNTLGALFGSLIISGHSAVMLPGEVTNAFVKEPTPY